MCLNCQVPRSILQITPALTRKLLGETKLNVTSVVGELNPFICLTKKAIKGQNGTLIVSEDCIQLNYSVNADGGKVVINPNIRNLFGCHWKMLYV